VEMKPLKTSPRRFRREEEELLLDGSGIQDGVLTRLRTGRRLDATSRDAANNGENVTPPGGGGGREVFRNMEEEEKEEKEEEEEAEEEEEEE